MGEVLIHKTVRGKVEKAYLGTLKEKLVSVKPRICISALLLEM